MAASPEVSVRAGLIGLFLAFLIYFLWKASVRLCGILLPDKYSGFVIMCSGLLLWAVWFAVAQVIVIAYDEVTVH